MEERNLVMLRKQGRPRQPAALAGAEKSLGYNGVASLRLEGHSNARPTLLKCHRQVAESTDRWIPNKNPGLGNAVYNDEVKVGVSNQRHRSRR